MNEFVMLIFCEYSAPRHQDDAYIALRNALELYPVHNFSVISISEVGDDE